MSLDSNKITHPLKVKQKIRETADAYSFVLEIPEELKPRFKYQPGQFVSFFIKPQDKEISRSYSLSSSPLVDTEFKVTVKRVPGGLGSNYLIDSIQEGDVLRTTPPSGHFFHPSPNNQPQHYLLFAGGSGITPIFSILKSVLHTNSENKVILIYANRNEEQIIYHQEINEFKDKFPNRLTVKHILSQAKESWCDLKGRCDADVVRQVVDEAKSQPGLPLDIYICGPAGYMVMVKEALLDISVPKESIHEESFGVNIHQPNLPPSLTQEAPSMTSAAEPVLPIVIGGNYAQIAQEPKKILAMIDGDEVEVDASTSDSILESLINGGANPPYSCMDGACMACMGKVTEGRVYMEEMYILSDENIANKEVLTCQAKPLSPIVKVDYDSL